MERWRSVPTSRVCNDGVQLGKYALLLDGERKSIEPMTGRLAQKARKREALRQRLAIWRQAC